MYEFTTDNEELATANNEGKVTTHGGPGVITVRAAMVRGSANYDEAKVRWNLFSCTIVQYLYSFVYVVVQRYSLCVTDISHVDH